MADVQKLIVNNTDYDIDDPNDVEKEDGELADTVINYESATTPTIGSFTQFLDRFVSGTKVGAWFKNFRAGCEFLLHIGSLVNNCVSDNEALPLAASQGKVLMDLITDANAAIEDNKNDLESEIGTKYSELQTLINSANNSISGLQTSVDGKAPTSHASSATTYGVGTTSNYGHLKISDNYTSSAGAASAGVAASSQAAYNAYNTLLGKLTDGSVTKVGTSNVGSGTQLMYLSSGKPTASTSNVGDSNTPVYLKSGVITSCGSFTIGDGTGASVVSSVDYINYAQYEHIVIVTFQFTVGSSDISEDSVVIATGLPKAYTAELGYCRDRTTEEFKLVRVNSSGELATSWGGALIKNHLYLGGIVYLCQ